MDIFDANGNKLSCKFCKFYGDYDKSSQVFHKTYDGKIASKEKVTFSYCDKFIHCGQEDYGKYLPLSYQEETAQPSTIPPFRYRIDKFNNFSRVTAATVPADMPAVTEDGSFYWSGLYTTEEFACSCFEPAIPLSE